MPSRTNQFVMENVLTLHPMKITAVCVEVSCPGEGYVCNNGQCEYVGVTHYIEIANMEYQTLYLEIKRHDTVVWTNNDSFKHSVTSNDSLFDSGKISTNGDSWSWQFNNGGSFMYYCTYHTDMYAEIVVV